MVTSTMSALPEHWTELNASRENRRLCAEDVESIKKKWEAEGDSSKPVVQSPEHLGQILNRMLQRYQDSSDREWFSERRAVVLGLETMFSEAKEGRVSLKEIEASIGSEKEAWYRWVLRKYPEFLAVAGPGVDQEDVRSILDDPDRSREELVAVVGQAVGMSADWSERVDAFAEKVVAAKGDSAELKKLYISEFFKNPSTGETLQDAQEYLDMYEADRDMGLEAIIDKIIAANRADRNSQAQRGAHQRRLDELRRAKTAFEQNNVRSKSQKENPQANLVDEAYYNLPPCSVCKKDVDPSRVIACPICQMILHMGGQKALTVYCSEGCYEKGFVRFHPQCVRPFPPSTCTLANAPTRTNIWARSTTARPEMPARSWSTKM